MGSSFIAPPKGTAAGPHDFGAQGLHVQPLLTCATEPLQKNTGVNILEGGKGMQFWVQQYCKRG